MQRNQELEYNNDVLQRMVYKFRVINEALINENKSLKDEIENKKKQEEEENKKKQEEEENKKKQEEKDNV